VEEITTQRLGVEWKHMQTEAGDAFALDGQFPLVIALHGKYLFISDSLAYLAKLSVPTPPQLAASPALITASVNYRRERDSFAALARALDGANFDNSAQPGGPAASAEELSSKRPAGFLAGNVRSLSQSLRTLSSEVATRRVSGNKVFETVTYGFER
jgi:hypothetical protein